MRRRSLQSVVALATLVALAAMPARTEGSGSKPQVVVLHLDDTIQPISEEYLA